MDVDDQRAGPGEAALVAAAAQRSCWRCCWCCCCCLASGLVLLDSAPGHRWLVDRIASMETATGLKIQIGRIDGSIFGKSRLQQRARVGQQGRVPDLARNHARLGAGCAGSATGCTSTGWRRDRVTLSRLPALKPTGRTGPLLPGFDIHIGRLDIRRLELGSAVTGTPRVGAIGGSADIRERPGDGAARCGGARRRPVEAGHRRRARPRPLRHRGARQLARQWPAAGAVRVEASARTGDQGRRQLVALARYGGDEPVGTPRRQPRAGGGFGSLSAVGQGRPGTVPQGPPAAAGQPADRRRGDGDARGPTARRTSAAVDAVAAGGGARCNRPWRERIS